MYLERRRRRFYAVHDIPADVQGIIGRRRFVQSLQCEDRPTAERRAAVLAPRWLTEIARARRVSPDAIERDALFWRATYREAPPQEKEGVREMIEEEAHQRVIGSAIAKGILDYDQPGFDELPAHAEARRFVGIATGEVLRLDEHLEEYLGTLRNEAKTVDMKRSTISKFCDEFPFTSEVHRKDVQRWVNRLLEAGKALATVRRALSELRGYWAYLQSIEAVSQDALPFSGLAVPKTGKGEQGEEREAFEPGQVVDFHHLALTKGDGALADLIVLGMWTGCRIEELCSLRTEQVKADHFSVEDAKTPAGWRKIPIHPKLAPTLTRLVRESKDGYVMSGLTPNKYEDRSPAMSKRFGRLKTSCGFGRKYGYHSIRHTVATLFENAGVPENVAADIIGHDKPTMTYGLYSGGASLATKREAIDRLDYPCGREMPVDEA